MTTPLSTPSPRARWARLRAYAWRFHTLALAERTFGGASGPCVLRRPLFGYDLYIDVSRSNAQRLLFLEGERFLGERHLVRRLLRPGMHAADVGANLGYYALLVARAVGPAGTVACFEPEPDNLRELRRNVEANRLDNVRIFPVAVGSEEGTVSLRAGINGRVVPDGPADFTVPLRRLDDALDGPVDFIKVDVEGFEGHVLAGARRILREHRPVLLVEIHPGFLAPPYSVDDILGLLAEHYPHIAAFEIAPQGGFADKLKSRYLGGSVRRVPDREALLADCRAGRRDEPFWAVCSREPLV